jgi:amidophosphoribosyltransferase
VRGETTPATLHGHVAIGPTRYSTARGSCWENAQLAFEIDAPGGGIAVAHNGNLTNTAALAGQQISQESPASWPVRPRATSDTDVMTELLAREADLSLEDPIVHAMAGLKDLTEIGVGARIGLVRGSAWPGA